MATRAKAADHTARVEQSDHAVLASDVYEQIYTTILEHRLRSGTKLGDERLADIFGVRRPKIREGLARLAHEQIVEVVSQRGAHVAKPSAEKAADVLEARKVIEPALIRRLMHDPTPEKVQRLRQHLALEQAARTAGNTRSIIRLTGEFHILLSELAGNSSLMRSMRELVNLSYLITFLYNVPTTDSCRHDEHEELVDAIESGDSALVESLILRHLDNIENALKLEEDEEEMDLAEIFRRA
jgi:DNA-binding GntR family transcriptional regulator